MTNTFPRAVCALICTATCNLIFSSTIFANPDSTDLADIVAGEHRSASNIARNEYRHPVETLEFFGIQPDMTVVEISPGGGGWYTEILAPYLRDKGTYYAGSYDPNGSEYSQTNSKKYDDKLSASPDLYDRVKVTIFSPPAMLDAAPDGVADMVVTFRNFHNWIRRGHGPAAMSAMYGYLKPGGILGVVQHRQAAKKPSMPEKGYLREADIIKLAENAGFRLLAKSDINANAKDTKDYADGVWTLPPVYRLKDQDREKYAAIGESDRMTLKFIKPE